VKKTLNRMPAYGQKDLPVFTMDENVLAFDYHEKDFLSGGDSYLILAEKSTIQLVRL
jgi:hypothetical protein